MHYPWQCARKSVPLRPNQFFSPTIQPHRNGTKKLRDGLHRDPRFERESGARNGREVHSGAKENSAALLSNEVWGLRKLAYPIQKKSTGYYFCLSYTGEGNIVDVLELAFRRDERVIRFLTTVLDKHAVEYNARRRNGEMNQQKAAKETEAVAQ